MRRQWREKKQAAREKRTGVPTKEKAGRPKGYVVTAATRAKIKAAKAAAKAARLGVAAPEEVTADVVAGIAAARRLGYREQEIADFYGISVATVDRVLMDRKG